MSVLKKSKIVSALSVFLPGLVMAEEFIVSEPNDNGLGNVPNSLSWAILQANSVPGVDSIVLENDVSITGVMKRLIDSDITLSSNPPFKAISGENTYRPLFIKSGDVTISDITITNGLAKGGTKGGAGLGGAVFIYDGNVTLSNVTISNSQAITQGFNSNYGGGGMFGNGGGYSGGGLFLLNSSNSGTNYGGFGNYQNISANFGVGGGGNGGFGAGGGGSYEFSGRNGGFGGGGGSSYYDSGGDGGFGGGGGGSDWGLFGQPGWFASVELGAALGGGIFIRTGSLTLSGVTFQNNSADSNHNVAKGLGGGIFVLHTLNNSNGNNQGMPSSLPDVYDCGVTFLNNDSSHGVNLAVNNGDIFDVSERMVGCVDLIFEDGFD